MNFNFVLPDTFPEQGKELIKKYGKYNPFGEIKFSNEFSPILYPQIGGIPKSVRELGILGDYQFKGVLGDFMFKGLNEKQLTELTIYLYNLKKEDVIKIKRALDLILKIGGSLEAINMEPTSRVALTATLLGGKWVSNQIGTYIKNYDIIHKEVDNAISLIDDTVSTIEKLKKNNFDDIDIEVLKLYKGNKETLIKLKDAMEINNDLIQDVEKGYKQFSEIQDTLIDLKPIYDDIKYGLSDKLKELGKEGKEGKEKVDIEVVEENPKQIESVQETETEFVNPVPKPIRKRKSKKNKNELV